MAARSRSGDRSYTNIPQRFPPSTLSSRRLPAHSEPCASPQRQKSQNRQMVRFRADLPGHHDHTAPAAVVLELRSCADRRRQPPLERRERADADLDVRRDAGPSPLAVPIERRRNALSRRGQREEVLQPTHQRRLQERWRCLAGWIPRPCSEEGRGPARRCSLCGDEPGTGGAVSVGSGVSAVGCTLAVSVRLRVRQDRDLEIAPTQAGIASRKSRSGDRSYGGGRR
jgi:hypothetical protein